MRAAVHITQCRDVPPARLKCSCGGGRDTFTPYLYGNKEFESRQGLNLYDFLARTYAPDEARFWQPDPKAGDYHGISPYVFCGADPVNFVDPDGCSTWVTAQSDGRYKVVGGDLEDEDLNIYVVTWKDGVYKRTGEILGVTPVITSFYNSDANDGKGAWATNSSIDINDYSGTDFLLSMMWPNTPNIDVYIDGARNYQPYDFKTTNGTTKIIKGIDIYRGMNIGYTPDDAPIYASARDIGNIVAGYVGAANNLPWQLVRLGFDVYQSYTDNSISHEGISSQLAQYYGYQYALSTLSLSQRNFIMFKSVISLVSKIF